MARTPSLILGLLGVAALAASGCGSDESTGSPPKDRGNAQGNAVTQPAGKGTTQGGKPTRPGQVEATMKALEFDPPSVSGRVGQKVVWTNDDSVAHTVTAKVEGGGPSSPVIPPGGTFVFVPEQKGTIGYFCAIHPTMEASLVVK